MGDISIGPGSLPASTMRWIVRRDRLNSRAISSSVIVVHPSGP
jgi:hypothetical protein